MAVSVAHLTELVGKMTDDGTALDAAIGLMSNGDMVIGRLLHAASAQLCSSKVAERRRRGRSAGASRRRRAAGARGQVPSQEVYHGGL